MTNLVTSVDVVAVYNNRKR